MNGVFLAAALGALAYLNAGFILVHLWRERDALGMDWTVKAFGVSCAVGLAVMGSIFLPAWSALGQG